MGSCPLCAKDLRVTRATLQLLQVLPEIEPSPEAWTRISANLPVRRAAVVRSWVRYAAAASILVAVLSFAAVLTMPRTGGLPVVAETGKPLKWNEPFRAPALSTLHLPGTWTLKVNKDATLRVLDPRTVVLESGELLADIAPSGRGFEIRTADTTVRVHGTRFGVSAPSTVYVLEGRVDVSSPRGRLELGPNQVAVGAALAEVSADDYLRWLAKAERPTVRLRLDPADRTVITPGSPLKWLFVLETDALAPLYLGDLRDVSQFLSLTINGHHASLDPNAAALKEATRASNGRVRLDVSHRVVIECAVDPALFRDKGRSGVRAVFTRGADSPDVTWSGIAQSDPITVEVR